MTQIAWATIRDQAIEQFEGQTPLADIEDRIITHFEHQPTIVIQAITEIAKATNVTWKWSALAGRLDKAAAGPSRNPVVQTGTTKTKATAAADAYIRNAGLHLDRHSEVQDELFGDRGLLRPWADQTKLQERMTEAWETIRPKGEQVDANELERAAKWVADRKRQPEPAAVTAAAEPEYCDPGDYDYGNPGDP